MEWKKRFAAAPVARLATADRKGTPHLVPITFAVAGDEVFFAIDHKPKRSGDLKRLRNIGENPRVSLLVDHYADDWSSLWWVRADGRAGIREEEALRADALRLLANKYRQYRERPPEGPVVAISVHRWTGWAFTPGAPSSGKDRRGAARPNRR